VREVKLRDPYGCTIICMCEKHFSSYLSQLESAYRGGTAYSSTRTSQRGCEFCRREKNENNNN